MSKREIPANFHYLYLYLLLFLFLHPIIIVIIIFILLIGEAWFVPKLYRKKSCNFILLRNDKELSLGLLDKGGTVCFWDMITFFP